MATSGTRSEKRSNKPVAGVAFVSNSGIDDATIIMTDVAGNSVTFTFDTSTATTSKVSKTNYTVGANGNSTTTHDAADFVTAVQLARANEDLFITYIYTEVYGGWRLPWFKQEFVPRSIDPPGAWYTIGGTGGTITRNNFETQLSYTSNSTNEFPVDELYIEPHVVVEPDFVLHHYDLDQVDANFNIDGTLTANPRQAPFSKRFQLCRTPGGDKTYLG